MALLSSGCRIRSAFIGGRYEIDGWLGRGGFGEAYRANWLDPHGRAGAEVCVKVSEDQHAWNREAYFGRLLDGKDRAIQIYESFVLQRRVRGDATILYVHVMELAAGGSLEDYLDETGNVWTEAQAKKEVVGILKLLAPIHAINAVHRDLTPTNVLVCAGRKLKLGDFGIAKQLLDRQRATASVMNRDFAPRGFRGRPVDDVYFVGQLFANLFVGDTDQITPAQTRHLPCGEPTRAVIARAIGPALRRYRDAGEMLAALTRPEDHPTPDVTSLRGKTVVFTGRLDRPRHDAELATYQAGASVQAQVTNRADILVVGRPSPSYVSGRRGVKLLAYEQLRKSGHGICLIGEPLFWRLAGYAR